MYLLHGVPWKDKSSQIQYNNSNTSLFLFCAIWLAGEKVLHFDKFHEQESRNYFPSAGSRNKQ